MWQQIVIVHSGFWALAIDVEYACSVLSEKAESDAVEGGEVLRGSYMSTRDPRPRFGQHTIVDAIEVHWPSGKVEKLTVPGANRIVTITEGTKK